MLRAHGRRAALVVAFVALLALVAPNAASSTILAAAPAAPTTAASAGPVLVGPAGVAPVPGPLADALRPVGPQVARTHQVDRPAAGHSGGWAVATVLLVLAGVALLVAVRRSSWRSDPAAWLALAPGRAPPAPHCC